MYVQTMSFSYVIYAVGTLKRNGICEVIHMQHFYSYLHLKWVWVVDGLVKCINLGWFQQLENILCRVSFHC